MRQEMPGLLEPDHSIHSCSNRSQALVREMDCLTSRHHLTMMADCATLPLRVALPQHTASTQDILLEARGKVLLVKQGG